MNSFSIQKFHKKYHPEICKLILEIQQTEFCIPISLEQQPDLKDIPTFYQKGNGNFWVALDQDHVIGTVALLDIGNGEGALRKMFVKEDYRGKLLHWAKEKQFKKIYLGTTSAFLAAHRFYEKNSFVEIKKENLPKTFPIMSVDSKFYVRCLL